jgi:uncharacterized damage-inducible protein DinB
MNTTIQGVDARGYTAGWLNALTGMYLADIAAIAEDQLSVSPGGVARSANVISAETVDLMNWTAEALKGNSIEIDHTHASAATMTTHAAITSAMQAATASLAQAITEASDETLNSMCTTPFGMTMPMFMVVQIAVNHIWYHDGQLNYFQALGGDGEIHWKMD